MIFHFDYIIKWNKVNLKSFKHPCWGVGVGIALRPPKDFSYPYPRFLEIKHTNTQNPPPPPQPLSLSLSHLRCNLGSLATSKVFLCTLFCSSSMPSTSLLGPSGADILTSSPSSLLIPPPPPPPEPPTTTNSFSLALAFFNLV